MMVQVVTPAQQFHSNDDDTGDDIWDESQTLSSEEVDDDISLDEQEWMIPCQYRSPTFTKKAHNASLSPSAKSKLEQSGHQRSSIGKIHIDYRLSESATTYLGSSSSSTSSSHSRCSSTSSKKILLPKQNIATSPRRSRCARYLDDESSAGGDESDLFTICHRSTTSTNGLRDSWASNSKIQLLLGTSCPQFESFDSAFQDDGSDIFDDEVDWTHTPMACARGDEPWLPDWNVLAFPETPSNFENNASIFPIQEQCLSVANERCGIEAPWRSLISPDVPFLVPPEWEAQEPLQATPIPPSSINNLRDSTRERRSSLDAAVAQATVTQRLGAPRNRYRAIPADKPVTIRIPTVSDQTSKFEEPVERARKQPHVLVKTKETWSNNKRPASDLSGLLATKQSTEPTHGSISRQGPAWSLRLKWDDGDTNRYMFDMIENSTYATDEDSTEVSSIDFVDECSKATVEISSPVPLNEQISGSHPDMSTIKTGECDDQLSNHIWSKIDEEAVMSRSDWMVVVVTGYSEDDEIESYHVHKDVLGRGPRACSFFQSEFEVAEEEKENAADQHDEVAYSIVEVEPSLAEAFPDLLHFIYSSHSPDQLEQSWLKSMDPQRHIALRKLGAQFGVKGLMETMDRAIAQ